MKKNAESLGAFQVTLVLGGMIDYNRGYLVALQTRLINLVNQPQG